MQRCGWSVFSYIVYSIELLMRIQKKKKQYVCTICKDRSYIFSLFIRFADYVWNRHIFSPDVLYPNLPNRGL